MLTKVMPKGTDTACPRVGISRQCSGCRNPCRQYWQDDPGQRNNHHIFCLLQHCTGCRITKRNAATYAESLQNKGFKEARVLITDTNVKVIYGSYSTENEAYTALNRLHSYEEFTDGWITKVKE